MGPPSPRLSSTTGGGGATTTPPSPRAKQQQQQQQQQQAFRAYVNTTSSSSNSSGSGSGSSRLYRSMENLNWAVSDPSLYGVPYRSVDSEFILHCTSTTTTTSHWYDGGIGGIGGGVQAEEDIDGDTDGDGDGGGGGQFHEGCPSSPPNPESLAFYPRRALARRDLPLQLFPPWMFPPAGGALEEWAANGNARKGLRDKLRLQSARTTTTAATEPLKPLRPQVTPGNGIPITVTGPPNASATWGWGGGVEKEAGSRSLSARRITSPEEIKQEVLRRLQLRRQNSSPNLAMHVAPPAAAPPQDPQNGNMSRSFTSEPQGGSSGGGGGGGSSHSTPERKRPPMGRLHIPTFEEFKRMRQREGGPGQPVIATAPSSGQNGNCSQSERNSCAQSGQGAGDEQDGRRGSQQDMDTGQDNEDRDRDKDAARTIAETKKTDAVCDPNAQTQNQTQGPVLKHTHENSQVQCQSQNQDQHQIPNQTLGRPLESSSNPSMAPAVLISTTSSTTSLKIATAPICTGPAPRSPLGGGGDGAGGATESSACPSSSSGSEVAEGPLGPFPPRKESGEAPSSCCPALLLEGADLSSYGAKIYSMRDGLLGSALDLIKKSCSAEIVAEASVRLSRERNESEHDAGVGGGGGDVAAGEEEEEEVVDAEKHVAAADNNNAPPPPPAQRRQSAGVAMATPACRAGAGGGDGGAEAAAGPEAEREEGGGGGGGDVAAGEEEEEEVVDAEKHVAAADNNNAPPPPPAQRRQSAGVAMATPACRAGAGGGDGGAEAAAGPEAEREEGGGGGGGGGGRGEQDGDRDGDAEEETSECLSGPGCRRSSSDAAYEPVEAVRAQRECRLRPHFSDPMPADAAKRKQLEMKIAAAARLHSHRRERDGSILTRGRSEPRGETGLCGGRRTGGGQHRWSTVSSLSADSGVVGLSDERDDEDEPRQRAQRHSAGAEVERTDSGIGPGLARSWKRPSAALRAWEARRPCPDCGKRELGINDSGGGEEAMCERCSKLRTERKEAILEFLNTEASYGEDLRIIKEEFYCPMQSAGLLASEQLTVVFGNVQELIDVNERFTEHLQESIDQAFDQGDEDLLSVCIGEIFLEFVNMLPAFQTYCLQQSASVNMLNALEKEKELLRIFLDVSQNDNTALRRMNLRSFLMAPLQRVTKYPLLLSRISKATSDCHPDHARLREAKSRVESHLEHINMKTRQEGLGGTATWSLRSFRRESRKNREVINIEMREVSLRTVGWARESTRFVMEGPLQLSQPTDGQWSKKGSKALKFQNVQSLLMVHTLKSPEVGEGGGVGQKPAGGEQEQGGEMVRDGVLVLIKDKSSGKFTVLREPIRLANCVVSADPDCDDTFEVLDIRREAFVFRASDRARTQQWYRLIKRYTVDLGPWRKRRNALPNIMINTIQSRS
ncbi:uncharacterized protein si:dkey-91i10.2 [Sardina pilchardus]|uniref:uncharacterized protein si:dkey-91i10.2 n=1 Tax=Sardina pilchardus TaxID=27697 RepID=UPI002E0F1645